MRYPDLLNRPSRFAHWPAWRAGAVVLLVAVVMLWGLAHPPSAVILADQPVTGIVSATDPVPGQHPVARHLATGDDIALYEATIDAVRGGEDYYTAATRLLRANDYPLRPFVAVRLPTLAWFLAAVPHLAALACMALLLSAVILAWTVRLAPSLDKPDTASWASLIVMMNGLTIAAPDLLDFHEGWAALLVALSLGLYRRERWLPSVLLALAALLVRELTLPYVLLMGALALIEKRWREAMAWGLALLIFTGALALHAQAVWAVTRAADPASPGWAAGGGWAFLTGAVEKTTLLHYLPAPLAPLLLPLALLGWAAWDTPTGMRAFLWIGGFAIGMTFFGRPGNFYWAAMITPLLFVGLLFAPTALRDLLRSVRTTGAAAGAHATPPKRVDGVS